MSITVSRCYRLELVKKVDDNFVKGKEKLHLDPHVVNVLKRRLNSSTVGAETVY